MQQAQSALTQMGTATDALLAKLRTAETSASAMARAMAPLTATLQQTAQAETQASQAATQLTTALQRTTQATEASAKAQASHQQALQANTQALTTHHQATQQASTGVASFGSAMGVATGVLGAFGVALSAQAVVQFGKSVVETGVKMEQLRRSLVAITGSTSVGRQEFAFVTETANRLGIGIETLATSYRGLTAATRGTELAGQDTQALFIALSTASRTFGMSSEQTGRALLAFQQIASKGKLSQEELRQQLGEALPGASQIAARAFGVTTQELEKMIEKGVSATDFWRRMTAQLAKETPAATAMAGQGFTQLGNEIVLWKDRMAQEGVLKFFEELAAKAAKVLEASRTAAAENQSATQRRATQVIGGEDPTKLLPENQRKLSEATEQLLLAEGRLRVEQSRMTQDAQARLQAGEEGARFGTTARVTALQKEVELLREKHRALGAVIQREEQAAKQARERGSLLTEPGAQFDAQERARKTRETEQKGLDAESTQARFREIDVRTQNAIEAQEKASQYKASPWRGMVEPIAEKYGVDPRLVEAVIAQESGNDPKAVSKTGARGLMQLMPGTGRDMGLAAGMEFDPSANITAGVKYLAEQLRLFSGNTEKALNAYHDGPGYKGIPRRIPESMAYAPAVLARLPQGDDKIADTASMATKQAQDAATYEKRLAGEVETAEHASRGARAAKLAEGEQLIVQMDKILSKYTKETEVRDMDTASALAAKAVMSDEISTRAQLLKGLIETAIAEKEHADAVEKAVKIYASAEQSLDRYQEQLGLSGGGKITAEARAVTRAERDLQALRGGPREAEAQKVVDGLKLQAKEAEPAFKQLARLSEDFADSFLNTMERATQGGIKSFKEFAASVLSDLMRMANQEFLKPALSGLIKSGLSAAAAYFAPTAGAGAANMDAATYGGGDMDFRAGGGSVTSNTPYVVGERGPEVFVPSQSGTIVPNGASVSQRQGQQAPPMIVNIYGVQDAAGLARSRGEIQRQMLSALQQAQRAA